MKVGVVQTIGVLQGENELNSFEKLVPSLLKTVKLWCDKNDYTHCVVPQPTTEYRLFKDESKNGSLLKYEACASVADQFDFVILLDADILVWGNPRVPVGDQLWMIRHPYKPQKAQLWDDGKIKPVGYFQCGPSEKFLDLYTWITQQCETATRDPEVECDYRLERRTSLGTAASYPIGVRCADESLLRHWCALQEVHWIPQNSLVHDFYSADAGKFQPNQFIHLGGNDKHKIYTYVTQMIHYYNTNKNMFNHLRDVKNMLYRYRHP